MLWGLRGLIRKLGDTEWIGGFGDLGLFAVFGLIVGSDILGNGGVLNGCVSVCGWPIDAESDVFLVTVGRHELHNLIFTYRLSMV